MGFQAFIKFALICLDDLAWPIFALGYPLRASIHAIETNSNSETKKLVTYWVIFSLISLFEHAFMGMLQWLPFWPYMKLTIVCWMMIPDFDGSFYVYNHFVNPCLDVDMETIINWFNKFQGFVLKDNSLVEAVRYVMMAHGPEALDKPIASESKDTNSSILQDGIKALQVKEKREVGPVNLKAEIEPNAAKTVNDAITVPEIKGEAGFDRPEIPSDKQQVQKEWACALCQVTTSSEITLNSHLQGRRHRNTYEELMKAKSQPSKGKVVKNPKFWCTICNIYCGCLEDLNNHLLGKKHLARIQELNGTRLGDGVVRQIIEVAWSQPPFGWAKINTDGSRMGQPPCAAAGGLIRDCHGRWLRGFLRNLGNTSVVAAELWGAYEGLRIAWEAGYCQVILELDSMPALEIIQKGVGSGVLAPLVNSIRWLLRQEWEVRLQHVYREGNRAADCLANLARTTPIGLQVLEDRPACLQPILFDDVTGTSFPRMCHVPK